MTQIYEECLAIARSELKIARQSLNDEITNYPTPISGCDAQFNHLLAEREKVRRALQSLDQVVFVPTPRSPSPDTGVESR
ncbi:MAG: hypothetical protein HKN18_01210 [Silicimonas sp.]|nr:hypothetical protein [Silicimonas sp.]